MLLKYCQHKNNNYFDCLPTLSITTGLGALSSAICAKMVADNCLGSGW